MKIGDKVVCVDDSPSKCPCCLGKPVNLIKNTVYVIKRTEFDPANNFCLHLIGVKPKHYIPWGYMAKRFRLLDELKKENQLKNRAKDLVDK